MGPRTRKTDPGPSLEIRLRKTDTAMPKHAAYPRLKARRLKLTATEQIIIFLDGLQAARAEVFLQNMRLCSEVFNLSSVSESS